ncbi:hypothetical protein Tco_0478027 [Tanacetum coccineum]
MKSLNSNSQEIELHQMQLEERQTHFTGMACFYGHGSHLKTLYPISDFFVTDKRDFETAFLAFFGEAHQIFRMKMFRNLDQLQLQFERENFHVVNVKTCLEVLRTQFREFFASKKLNSSDYVDHLWQEDFKDYTGCEPKTYRSDLLKYLDILDKFIDKRVLKYGELQMKECEVKTIKETEKSLNEAIPHEHEIEKCFKLQSKDVQINSVQAVDANLVVTKSNAYAKGKVDMGKALDAGLVVTGSSETKSDKQDTSSRSGNDTTHAVDAYIRPVNDQEPFSEVQLTAQHNVLANEQQHTEQSEPIYDTYLLEKVDSNTTPDSINISNRGGEIDQNAEKCQVTSPLLDPLTQPNTSEQSYQSLESENISLKKNVAQF